MVEAYRTRFAPSPTGKMHLGHARTALLTWLRARHASGRIVMRIEDIDQPRVVSGATDEILRDHEWLGLTWDEGPLFQSERGAHYEVALQRLQKDGLVYPCTCSRKEIASVASAPHGDEGPRYPGTCRGGVSHPERPAALRFRFEDPSPCFDDLLQGRWPEGRVGGDFIVRRADGLWAYQLAVVVDDADMGITEVIRGSDLLSSTSRQIALYEALGYPIPRFAHIGLVLGSDGTRLSKRHGASALAELRESGRTAEQITGWLAQSLGLRTDAAPVRVEELVADFSFELVSRAPCVWPEAEFL